MASREQRQCGVVSAPAGTMRGLDGSGSRNRALTLVSPMSMVESGRALGRTAKRLSLAAWRSMVAAAMQV